MCYPFKDCYLKYNAHVEEVKEKLNNETGEVVAAEIRALINEKEK